MKSRITITLDPNVIRHGKRVARARDTSLSGLIEGLLREQGRPESRQWTDSFSKRWRGKLTLREDSADELLQALKAKHGLDRT
jgi:hypothetical protein